MVRGVSFEIPDTDTGEIILWQVLNCVNIENYCWHIDQDEVLDSKYYKTFFEEDYYDGQSFLKRILSAHYLIFLKLQAYPPNGNFFDIHSYEDFQASDCELLVLIADSVFFDIYAKDQAIIKAIYENAEKNNYTNILYKTKSNDSRTRMDVITS
jgi:hypothetical protein